MLVNLMAQKYAKNLYSFNIFVLYPWYLNLCSAHSFHGYPMIATF